MTDERALPVGVSDLAPRQNCFSTPRNIMPRKHNKTGRSRRGDRFVCLYHWMLKSPAWRSLTPQAVAIYVFLAQRYNGSNNGEISASAREIAQRCHVSKDTVTRALRELQEKGFVKISQKGSFDWKQRHATTWTLTAWPLKEGELATKDFMNWGKKQTPVLNQGHAVP